MVVIDMVDITIDIWVDNRGWEWSKVAECYMKKMVVYNSVAPVNVTRRDIGLMKIETLQLTIMYDPLCVDPPSTWDWAELIGCESDDVACVSLTDRQADSGEGKED
jgi:hypothetical protein